jgi:hypothetical protein
MARETRDYEFANRLLDYAETVARNRANVQTRNEIADVIRSYQESEEDQARR